MKIVVFTTVLGKTDMLRAPRYQVSDIEYLCLTDDPMLEVPGWSIITVPAPVDPIRESRHLKIVAHETVGEFYDNVDATLWIDAAYELMIDPMPIADRWLWRTDMLAMKHPDRTNIDAEATELVRLQRAPSQLLEAQIADYRINGFDPKQQTVITSTGFCFRRNAPRVNRFNAMWWRLFEAAGHTRDQMSVDYAIRRSGIDVTYLAGHYRDNPYARWHSARRR